MQAWHDRTLSKWQWQCLHFLVNYAFMFILLTMLLYSEIRFKCIDQQMSYKAYLKKNKVKLLHGRYHTVYCTLAYVIY